MSGDDRLHHRRARLAKMQQDYVAQTRREEQDATDRRGDDMCEAGSPEKRQDRAGASPMR